MDATYWGRRFGVVIMKDHISGRVLWYKFIDKKETIADYREGISYFELHGYNVLGIVSDGLKGLRQEFHQLMTIRTKLTLHPKLQASQDLLSIAKILCHTDKDSFIGALTAWHEKWKDFINEGAKGADGKMHYVHKNTRSAYLSLKRNTPWLWTFYDFPELQMPNTNNELEALNSTLKAKLNLHKGISKERRKVIIQDFLKNHSLRR